VGAGIRLPDLRIGVGGSLAHGARSPPGLRRFAAALRRRGSLPAAIIEAALDADIRSWLDAKLWARRDREIDRARALL
jgi:hypothetical protein